MQAFPVSDAFIASAYKTFCDGRESANARAALSAMYSFISNVQQGDISLADAKALLLDHTSIDELVDLAQGRIDIEDAKMAREASSLLEKRVDSIHAISERTLTGQDTMRAEVASMIGEMRAEFSGMHQELRGATQSGLALAKQNAETANVITGQVSKLDKLAADMHTDVKKAVGNTTRISSMIAGFASGFAICLIPGIPIGLATAYYYERHLSVQAMAKAAQKPSAASIALPPRKVGAATSFVAPQDVQVRLGSIALNETKGTPFNFEQMPQGVPMTIDNTQAHMRDEHPHRRHFSGHHATKRAAPVNACG